MSNGTGCTWRVARADILEKQRGIFPLFREWMRREMNSSEAFQFVTIEQSESRLEDSGTKCVRFLVFPCLCAPSLFCPPPPFPVKIWQQKPKLKACLLTLLVMGGGQTGAPSPSQTGLRERTSSAQASADAPEMGFYLSF